MITRLRLASWVLGSLFCLTTPATAIQSPTCSAASGAHALPLVELYTSEGCDSCPPADRWLRRTFPADASAARAAVLAFHVDYWDALGWPDRFASRAYTQRQY